MNNIAMATINLFEGFDKRLASTMYLQLACLYKVPEVATSSTIQKSYVFIFNIAIIEFLRQTQIYWQHCTYCRKIKNIKRCQPVRYLKRPCNSESKKS